MSPDAAFSEEGQATDVPDRDPAETRKLIVGASLATVVFMAAGVLTRPYWDATSPILTKARATEWLVQERAKRGYWPDSSQDGTADFSGLDMVHDDNKNRMVEVATYTLTGERNDTEFKARFEVPAKETGSK